MARRRQIKVFANLDDAMTKRQLMQVVGTLYGLYDIEISPTRLSISHQKRKYFHAAVVPALMEYLNDPGHGTGQSFTFAQCKDLIVAKVLGVLPVVNPRTGEVVDEVRPSTEELDDDGYGDLIEQSIAWLAETFGIVVMPPEVFYAERNVKSKRAATAA